MGFYWNRCSGTLLQSDLWILLKPRFRISQYSSYQNQVFRFPNTLPKLGVRVYQYSTGRMSSGLQVPTLLEPSFFRVSQYSTGTRFLGLQVTYWNQVFRFSSILPEPCFRISQHSTETRFSKYSTKTRLSGFPVLHQIQVLSSPVVYWNQVCRFSSTLLEPVFRVFWY